MRDRFINPYPRSLDAKGRLMLPQEYRAALLSSSSAAKDRDEGTFWLTAYDGHLTAYLPDTWVEIREQLYTLRSPSRNMQNFRAKFLGLAQQMTPDTQGRIRIPQPLIREAGLQKDVMLLGMKEQFQIWDAATFYGLPVEDVTDELAAAGVEIIL
ncbi:MAG: division/cell wall cluster transcriptional repressor MraZ [Desulfovibrio sp.]|nr:division/cell wall cluster transcriptional repressor MraZ [Desulfovibrio sp.]